MLDSLGAGLADHSPLFCPLLISLWVVTLPFSGGRRHSRLVGLGYLGHSWPDLRR